MGKASKIASKVGTVILCLVLAVAVTFLVLQVFTSKGKALPGGYRPLIVLSGSMEPVMPVGSAVVSKRVDPASVKVGDIVTYAQVSDPTGKTSPFVTHRVTKVIEGTGALSFVTKGDANNAEDQSPIPASRLVGRVVAVMPFVGDLTRFIHSPLGLILMILLPGAILIAWEGTDMVKRRKKVVQRGGTAALAIILCLGAASQAGLALSSAADFTAAYFATATQPLTGSIITETRGQEKLPPPTVAGIKLTRGHAKAVRPSSQMRGGPASLSIASLR